MVENLLSRQTGVFKSPALRRITLEVAKVGGVNLAQGVCQLPVPPLVATAASKAIFDGHNVYTNPRGTLELREALAAKFARDNNIPGLDPETEILVTCGATGAFEGICACLLDPGDEVVAFEPSYPYHLQTLARYGANVKIVKLNAPEWSFDIEDLKAAVTSKTKFVLVNTPHNPTGKIFSQAELEAIAAIIEPTQAVLVTDEIYEYLTFDGHKHVSAASLDILKGRVLTMGGYSKTFSITGWRIGYLVAPKTITPALTAALDAIYVCPPAPLQMAVAAGINEFGPDFYTALSNKYKGKRDRFEAQLTQVGLTPNIPNGAYYMIASYQNLSDQLSSDFVTNMIQTVGVGAVPSDDFVQNPENAHWVRFCLALEDDRLDEALQRISKLNLAKV